MSWQSFEGQEQCSNGSGSPITPPSSSSGLSGVPSTCARCGGFMHIEHYIDLHDDTGQIGIMAYRCLICGEVIDPTILRNRVRPAPNLLYGTKQRNFAQRIKDKGSSAATPSEEIGDLEDADERP